MILDSDIQIEERFQFSFDLKKLKRDIKSYINWYCYIQEQEELMAWVISYPTEIRIGYNRSDSEKLHETTFVTHKVKLDSETKKEVIERENINRSTLQQQKLTRKSHSSGPKISYREYKKIRNENTEFVINKFFDIIIDYIRQDIYNIKGNIKIIYDKS